MQHNSTSKGFFTFAQNNSSTDYVRLAYALALSLKHSQSQISNISIGVTPGTVIDNSYLWAFDKVIEIPWHDDAAYSDWKLHNEWKSIWMSPYDETIKLDCDMLFLSDINDWWNILSLSPDDIVFTNTVLNWRGDPITDNYYRKTFTKNKLPNLYSGFFYFRKTRFSYQFFSLAKIIFWNWERFFEEFLHHDTRPLYPSTDVIFSLAMKILDDTNGCYVNRMFPTFTHMKTRIQGWNDENLSDNWQDHIKVFFDDTANCNIGNHRQLYPLHYHKKDFITEDIIKIYEKILKHG